MLESLFAFLFKYRPLLFQEGELALATSAPQRLALAGLAAAAVVALSYGLARAAGRRRERLLPAALRLGAVALLLLALARPTLRVPGVVPRQSFVAVVVDDSRSMRVADDGASRGAAVTAAFAGPDAAVRRGLEERFGVRYFRAAGDASRVAGVDALAWDGTRTRLAAGIDRALADLAGVPLAGVVLVTDGADGDGAAMDEALGRLRAAGVPLYAVGLGRDRLDRDIQLGRVEPPRRVLQGAAVVVDLVVTHTGYAGETVPVQVEDGGRILAVQEMRLPADGEPATVRLRFDAAEAGARRLTFRVPPRPDERIAENNARAAIVRVDDRREKILYLEGEPRFEVKFLRRAIADDENLHVVVLQRTAEGKFLRLDVDSAGELAGGFPTTREELFGYRALVLGSVEAGFFTHDQLQMIADFVDRRGGGLLALGGRRAFAEGGYAGTPVADVLPVVVGPQPAAAPGAFYAELHVEPTAAGAAHPATLLAADEPASAARWAALPAVSTRNRLDAVKPGAVTLLVGRGDSVPGPQPVLAYQRYGRGKAAALAIQDSWLWQMHADVAVDDLTHETFWRQLLRWLVDGVPATVAADASAERAEPGERIELRGDVRDDRWLPLNDATVTATVTGPDGERALPLDWSPDRDGRYAAGFAPPAPGLYEVRVEASRDGEPLGADVVHIEAGTSDEEYFDATLREPLLRAAAEATGGRYYTAATLGDLPEDLAVTGAGVTVIDEKELWDAPIVFLLLLGLLGGEWLLRRKRGLA